MSGFINEQHARIFAETSGIPGPQMPGDTELLFELGYRSGDVILEVGTYAGRSAVAELKGALSAGKRPQYFGIDISYIAINDTVRTLKRSGLYKRALIFNGDIAAFRQQFKISPSMVFLDGDHEYDGIRSDLEHIARIVRPGTPIACHDYLNQDTPGVKRAVDEWVLEGWAAPTQTSGCSILLRASEKCTDGSAAKMTYITFQLARMRVALDRSERSFDRAAPKWIMGLRRSFKLRTKMKWLASQITRRI
jgi:predicted O-methyltransferase YrrM